MIYVESIMMEGTGVVEDSCLFFYKPIESIISHN